MGRKGGREGEGEEEALSEVEESFLGCVEEGELQGSDKGLREGGREGGREGKRKELSLWNQGGEGGREGLNVPWMSPRKSPLAS
mgnify:CR=1 FL=1